MSVLNIINGMKKVKLSRSYVLYSIAYGLSSLIIPFGVQFLVNSLALSGIWLNTLSFLFLIALALILSQLIKHSQVVLIEFIQREIFVDEIEKWKGLHRENYSHYFFEVITIVKSFAKAYASLVELILVVVFGLSAIIVFHPAFAFLAIIIGLVLRNIYKSSDLAIKSSIDESNQKYQIFDLISGGRGVTDESIDSYLEARDKHFSFTKSNSFKISLLTILVQLLLLAVGSFLIMENQLSVGQLVSAELIISGIFASLVKLPHTLESVYDFETSSYKIAGVLDGETE